MPSRLLLLSEHPPVAEALVPLLSRQNLLCPCLSVGSLAEIEAALDTPRPRLIAFCTAIIVPARLLAELKGDAYNVHPGPPNYPGRYPARWGAYDGVHRFGATLHKMAPRVDEGPIVAVEWFDVSSELCGRELADRAFAAAVALFQRCAAALAAAPELPSDPRLRWSGRKTTRADYEAMRRWAPGLDAAEAARRRRAFEDDPGAAPTGAASA